MIDSSVVRWFARLAALLRSAAWAAVAAFAYPDDAYEIAGELVVLVIVWWTGWTEGPF